MSLSNKITNIINIGKQYASISKETYKHCAILFKGKNIDKGLKSITFNLVFQAEDRTLQDVEIDNTMATIHKILRDEADAKLR